MGDVVLCDYCDKEYTDSDETGGAMIGSYAVCPKCLPKAIKSCKEYKETNIIHAVCPDNMSFKEFVYNIRHGVTFKSYEELSKDVESVE